MKFAFLILHYQNIDVTLSCIDSINSKCLGRDYEIIVVDNNSPNKSGVLLKQKFADNSLVTVIISDKNLGFAKGNNLGFAYIKSKICPNYIIMTNSDTEIMDVSFLDRIESIDLEQAPAVIGPQIILANGEIGKYPFEAVNTKYLKKEIIHFFIKRFLYVIGLAKLVRMLEKESTQKKVKDDDWKIAHENVVLNGCCLIFTKKYIDLFDGIFDQTFMYKEEQFLFYRLKRASLSSFYSPDIRIKHLERASTNGVEKQKVIDFYSREIASDKLLIKYLKDETLL